VLCAPIGWRVIRALPGFSIHTQDLKDPAMVRRRTAGLAGAYHSVENLVRGDSALHYQILRNRWSRCLILLNYLVVMENSYTCHRYKSDM
jgi:hypothetical protein